MTQPYLNVYCLGMTKGQPAREELEHKLARANALLQIGQRIAASQGLEEILHTTVQAVSQCLHYDDVTIFLTDTEDPEYLMLRARGKQGVSQLTKYRQSIHQGIVGRAFRLGKAVLIQDAKNDGDYIMPEDSAPFHSELALPIMIEGKTLGVFNLKSQHLIEEDDSTSFVIIMQHLAVAIQHTYLFANTQQTLADTELLFETSRRISTANSLQEVAKVYLELVATQGKYNCTVVIYDYDEWGNRSEIIVLGRWRIGYGLSQEMERYPYFKDDFDITLDAGQAVFMSYVPTDPRASKTLRETQVARPALALIPLMVQDQRIGLVTLNHHQAHDWLSADLRPYQVTAAQLATTLYSRRQQQILLQREQALAVLSERQRLARDLHDSVNQLIFGMTLIAQSIGPAMQRDIKEGEARVKRLLELAQHTRAEMRALLTELRPGISTQSYVVLLKKDGLVKTLEHYLSHLPENLKVVFDAQHYKAHPQLEEALLRVTQEAVGNIIKHARAREIHIHLYVDDVACYLEVKDDGQGFEVTSQDSTHMGLRTMRERIEILGGQLQIFSTLFKGTLMRAQIPLKEG